MRDPAFRNTLLAMGACVVIGVGGGLIFVAGAPASVIIALPLIGGGAGGLWLAVHTMRAKPIVSAPQIPAVSSEKAAYDERVTSIVRREWLSTMQALKVTVAGGVLSVSWDGSYSRKYAQFAPTFGAMGTGLGFSAPIGEIVVARKRRLSFPHFVFETLRPYQGLGMLGEWKFRVRGVRTGVSVRTRNGLKAWISTRQPDELLAALSIPGEWRSDQTLVGEAVQGMDSNRDPTEDWLERLQTSLVTTSRLRGKGSKQIRAASVPVPNA